MRLSGLCFEVVRALVPRMGLDDLFEQKGEVAKSVLEELEKVKFYECELYCGYHIRMSFYCYGNPVGCLLSSLV